MNVVIMVSEGYPLRFSANNTKGQYIALGLKESGCSVAMMDGLLGTKGETSMKQGVSDTGIPYYIFPRRGVTKSVFSNIIRAWKTLKHCKKRNAQNHIILGIDYFPLFIISVAIAWILGYRRSALFHEAYSSIPSKNFLYKIDYYLRDSQFGYFVNLILPISHYLEEKAQKFKRPSMILPVLADFTEMSVAKETVLNHFTYCCGAAYLLRNTMIVDAFLQLLAQEETADCKLILVIVGNNLEIDNCRKYIDNLHVGSSIELRYQVPFHELMEIYSTSIALIVPLNPENLQDKARFSQKIAEYVATGRPIITNNVGEIPYYFQEGESAQCAQYSVEGFAKAMKILSINKKVADEIGERGRQVGCQYFNYKTICKNLLQKMNEI